MIKLTGLDGRAVWLRSINIAVVRDPIAGEFEANARAVCQIGSQTLAVRESVAQVLGALGMQVG